jgi:hypothetical protein
LPVEIWECVSIEECGRRGRQAHTGHVVTPFIFFYSGTTLFIRAGFRYSLHQCRCRIIVLLSRSLALWTVRTGLSRMVGGDIAVNAGLLLAALTNNERRCHWVVPASTIAAGRCASLIGTISALHGLVQEELVVFVKGIWRRKASNLSIIEGCVTSWRPTSGSIIRP